MKFSFRFMLLFITGNLMAQAWAHVPYIEEDALRRFGEPVATEDFSFDYPFVIQGQLAQSKAIFAYLRNRDVDVYQFTITQEQIDNAGPPYFAPFISASALAPACKVYKNFYPRIALIGPGLPPAPADINLPFDVAPDRGVVVAGNAKAGPGEQRPIFDLPEGDASWFLPIGLTQECLLKDPQSCDYSNTIAQPIFLSGVYHLVIWNPNGMPADYTANIGFLEIFSALDEARVALLTPLVERSKIYHRPCRRPY